MKKEKKPFWKFLLFLGFFFILLVGFSGFVIITYFSLNLPQIDNFSDRPVPLTTKIYDKTGEVLLYDLYGDQKRTAIPLQDIPDSVKKATLALEDKDFYTHPAFSIKGILRALYVNITQRELTQGGSTITQQLVKTSLLDPQRTISRKIKEIILAYKLEQLYSKDQILELYLNEIPYGGSAYGIEAASQTYFDKSASKLTLAEAAILASLPNAPTYYSPYGSHINKLYERQRHGLLVMKEKGWISEQEYQNALNENINFAHQKVAIRAPHFVMMVINYLNEQYGEEYVRSAGLKITTTLDWSLQEIAEDVIKQGVERNTELYKGTNAALVSEDPKTGHILALVGSKDYFDTENDGNFDVATQGLRQPGSSFKPIAYVTALKKGYTPQTILFDVKTEFDTTGDPKNSYQPENFDHAFGGPVTLKEALANSLNIPAVKVLYLAGMSDVIDMARQFGISTLGDYRRYGLSLVLGGGEVRLIEMVNAYSIFAQDGTDHKQSFILKVETKDGKVLEEYTDESKQIIEAEYARQINDILSDDDARSRLFQRRGPLYFEGYDVAAKTGTTNDYRDAWVIGYTPNIVTGIWAGNNDNTPMQQNAGSILAAVPILQNFYSQVLPKRENETFTNPSPVSSNKPMLNGQYIVEGNVHSILYYVNKDNPQGPYPINPSFDPQFKNWEEAIQRWASEYLNISGSTSARDYINNLAQLSPVSLEPLQISFVTPKNGDYITFPFTTSLSSNKSLQNIKIFFNDILIQEIKNPPLHMEVSIAKGELYIQNVLQIEALDTNGKTITKKIILFGKN